MNIKDIQNEIIEEFSLFDDWMDKYQHVIEQSKGLQPIEEQDKNDDHLINGCQSRVWLAPAFKEGKVYFTADSDAVITKGLAALLIRVFSGQSPKTIIETEPYFINEIGLQQHLSPTRSNGLLAMVKQIKLYAMAYQAQSN